MVMSEKIYELPVPSTALLNGVFLQLLPKRTCMLTCEYEDERDEVISLKLIFEGVEAFRCTFHKACAVELIKTAYDKVVDLGASPWFSEVTERLTGAIIEIPELRHLAIYFDDGPCYEFICGEFHAEKE
jgi:hypothetical protein